MSEARSIFSHSQGELEEILAEIDRQSKSKINEHATKYAVLKLAKTPEEAILMVEYLTAIDWYQVFVDKAQHELDSILSSMESLAELTAQGGGFCDGCDKEVVRLYTWPHDYPHVSYKALYENFHTGMRCCWKCFREEQQQLSSHFIEAFRRAHNSPPGHYIWKHELWTCRTCKRLMPYRSRFEVMGDGYCLHCVEQAAEQQFIYCQICGKKTTNFKGGAILCIDCNVTYPYQSTVKSHLGRSRSAGLQATLTPAEWVKAVEYFGGLCAYCRSRPYQELEHFLPHILGGGTTADNCVPACVKCNGRKSDKHPDRFPEIFSHQVITNIRTYLESDKTNPNTLKPQGRELAVIARQARFEHGEKP